MMLRAELKAALGNIDSAGASRAEHRAIGASWLQRLQRPSFRILMRSRWEQLKATHARQQLRASRDYYRRHRGGRHHMVRPPGLLAYGEIETMYLAGFRSLRAWRKARRYGGFPEPARITTDGPVWTERQIAEWLGIDSPEDAGQDVITPDEARLLRQLEAA